MLLLLASDMGPDDSNPGNSALQVACISCSPDLIIIDTSTFVGHLIGQPEAKLVGKHLTEAFLPLFGYEQQLEAIYHGEQPYLSLEQIRVGESEPASFISLTVIRYGHGLLVVIRDATLQNQQQQRLQQQHHELLLLHEQLAAKHEELKQLNSELAELNQRKSDILAIATHDLRSPLTAIVGYADMLVAEMMGPVNESQHEALEAILRQGRHMSTLMKNLLDLRRLETSETAWQRTINLPQLLMRVQRSFHDQATLARVSLRLVPSSDPTPITLYGDDEMLQQAIANLVSNGIKYTQPGGVVTIRLRRLNKLPTLGSQLNPTRSWCAIEVSDTGVGISKDDLTQIFEPFFRTQEARIGEQPGSGLGLTIVQRVVQQHGGRAQVTSHPGQGSTFTLLLPCDN